MPFHPESCFMSSPSAAASSAINVLSADSNRMQAQLLTSALRRRSEFRIFTCPVDVTLILQAVASNPAKVVVLSLNHSDRKSTRLNSSHLVISYAVFCL